MNRPMHLCKTLPLRPFARCYSSEMKTRVIAQRELKKHIQTQKDDAEYRVPVLDAVAYNVLLTEIMRGSWLTFQQIFSPPVTIFYPQEKGKNKINQTETFINLNIISFTSIRTSITKIQRRACSKTLSYRYYFIAAFIIERRRTMHCMQTLRGGLSSTSNYY